MVDKRAWKSDFELGHLQCHGVSRFKVGVLILSRSVMGSHVRSFVLPWIRNEIGFDATGTVGWFLTNFPLIILLAVFNIHDAAVEDMTLRVNTPVLDRSEGKLGGIIGFVRLLNALEDWSSAFVNSE